MQDIIKEVKCPQCANIYECRSYVLKSGENKFGKIGDVKDSIVKNCIKKLFMMEKFILLHNALFVNQEKN